MQRDVSPAGSSKAAFRTDIQALRGIAVLLVVLYHAGLPGLSAGYLGVDVFFVISGFLITTLIKREIEEGTFSFSNFYFRRARRLLPAAYLVILITIIASPFFLTQLEMQDLRLQVLGAITFTANIAQWQQSGYFDAAAETKALLHFWSLAVEEQYYLLVPMALWFLPRRSWAYAIVAVLLTSFFASVYLATASPDAAFYLLPTRAWELAIGSVGALIPNRYLGIPALSMARIPAWAVLIGIPFAPTGAPHPGLDAALACFATLVVILGHDRSRWETTLPMRAVAWIGDISYSLYLVHWPILVFARVAWLGEPPHWALWVAVIVSVAASWGMFRWIEEPFRRSFSARRTALAVVLVATSLVIAIAPFATLAAFQSDVDFGHVRRLNYGYGVECAAPTGEYHPSILCNGGTEDPEVIVWGDSYAMHLVDGIADVVGDLGVAQATRSLCGPIAGLAPVSIATGSRYDHDWAEQCYAFNTSVLNYILASPNIETVVMSSPLTQYTGDGDWKGLISTVNGLEIVHVDIQRSARAWANTIATIKAAGKRVVVFGPPPMDGFDPSDCLERKFTGKVMLGGNECEISRSSAVQRQGKALELLAQTESLADMLTVSFFDELCDDENCKTTADGTILYRDRGHLSYDGSRYLARSMNWREVLSTQ
ncbi:acyltransferase family protein [Neoaquamicrobium sediminum]|uniref:acyltransferase family protein n=1 Tax=Neoaquamicrobium sediminum TaxID=1849104 RepID=UPI003BA8BC68